MSSQTFNFTGSAQTFTVPDGVTEIQVDAQGAQGGANGNNSNVGGLGGRVVCNRSVTPGQDLQINVGGYPGISRTAGFNGGGTGGGTGTTSDGGAGGGASDVRQGGTALADRVVVAGGGGGAGGNGGQPGGNGGGGDGSPGLDDNTSGGDGATSSAGGAGSAGEGSGPSGASGTLGSGGAGGNILRGGAGGGGGYYGGGGSGATSTPGHSCGGGGGGSGLGTGVFEQLTSGYRSGDGLVVLTWPPPPPSNDYWAGATELAGNSGSIADDNLSATTELGEPVPTAGAGDGPWQTKWYKLALTASGIVTVDTIGSDFDTVIAAYSGTSLVTLVEQASDDDAAAPQSAIAFHAAGPGDIYIQVGGYSDGDVGNIVLNWTVIPIVAFLPPDVVYGMPIPD